MLKLVLRALVLGAIALGVWQLAAGGATVQAHHVGNTYDCEDFSNQSEAQGHFNAHPGDQDNLDTDDDDIACEQYDYNDDDDDSDDDDNYVDNDCAKYYNQPYGNLPYGNQQPYSNAYPYGYPYGTYGCLFPQHPIIIPAPSRTAHISMVIADTSIKCNEETALVARLLFPNGVGASAHLIQFQSTLGTVFSNVLTDPGGYAQTRFVAPSMPAQVQITAFGDGLTTTQTVNVTCDKPSHPPHTASPMPPTFRPPSTGDAGLVGSESNGSAWLLLGLAAVLLSAPAAAVAVVRQRR